MARTTAEFLDGLKSRGVVPASQPLMSVADFLRHADNVITGTLVPLIESCRGDYFVVTKDVALVDAEDTYAIPGRALARSLRDLKWKNTTDKTKRNMILIPLEQEADYSESSGEPTAFFFLGDDVVLRPVPEDPAATDVLEFWYSLWPNRLCAVGDAALVSSVSGGTITCTSVPATMLPGVKCDLIKGEQGNKTVAMDIVISSVAGNQVTFTSTDVPTGIVAGDWISIAGCSPVLQLPDACVSYLETAVCERVMQTIGDLEAASALRIVLKDEERALKMLLEPRVIGEGKIFVNHQLIKRSIRSRAWLNR